MGFVWFAACTFLVILLLRLGVRLWRKEREGRKALAKKISEDAAALVKETEAWVEKEWNRRFKGGG